MHFFICPFGVDLSPAFTVEAAGNFPEHPLVGVVPVHLVELCLIVLYWPPIEVFAVFDQTPRADLESSGFGRPLIEDNLIVNEATLLVVEVIELYEINVLMGRRVSFREYDSTKKETQSIWRLKHDREPSIENSLGRSNVQ